MRSLILAAGAALALGACSSGTNNQANAEMNAEPTATDNMMYDQNATMNAGGIDGNVATNATTENMMLNDMTHNDADTNLANGM